MLEHIAKRAHADKAGQGEHSRQTPAIDEAIAGLICMTGEFSYFSTAASGQLALGAPYTGGSANLHGGQALNLIGVSDEEIVYLSVEFDRWAE